MSLAGDPIPRSEGEDPPFSARLLDWFDTHGRHNLPWQHPRTPYRVWVSEIMLQQTQVSTVIGYFERFMARFPSLEELAAAPLDAVLSAWAGLGYYARARHLHAAAKAMAARGIPDTLAHWLALPGVGASTAAAIMAQAFDQPATILDGNVKRVVARHAGIGSPIEQAATIHRLYDCARAYTPPNRSADYTQAIMDLGATVCLRSQPHCLRCPVAGDCVAFIEQRTAELPARRVRPPVPLRPVRFWWWQRADGRVLLERRPASGIWGGLWCLPEIDGLRVNPQEALPTAVPIPERMLPPPRPSQSHGRFAHRLTHFLMQGEVFTAPADAPLPVATDALRWLAPHEWADTGLPKPIRHYLDAQGMPLRETSMHDHGSL